MAHMMAKSARLALKMSENALTNQRLYLAALTDLELHKVCLDAAKRALAEEQAKPKFTPIYMADPSVLRLDDQLKGLVRLAVSNPNENERRNAALIVCERLKGKIDGSER